MLTIPPISHCGGGGDGEVCSFISILVRKIIKYVYILQQEYYPRRILPYFLSSFRRPTNVETPILRDFEDGIPTFVVVSISEILSEKIKNEGIVLYIYIYIAETKYTGCSIKTENNFEKRKSIFSNLFSIYNHAFEVFAIHECF